ncbi:hypothetical protein [Roseateles chitosanitabidus]|uniref:hypothetical protein n=1 Tax=Roseateles chitosanitabidus TaxID=65048 RepID=UPI0011DF3B9C|nr:hypothetical protein [Roseateles chitosanitabidus]
MDDTPASPDDDLNAAPPPPEPAAPVAAPATPSAPWEGPSPDVVAWLLVNWHNKHPLARRLGIKDVHTVGAVALPFMAQALPKEPSLEAPATAEAAGDAAPAKPGRRWPWQRRAAPATGPRPAWREEFIPGLKTADVAVLALDNGFTSAPDELPLRRVEIDDQALAGEANQPGAWPMELVLLSAAFDIGPARRRVLVGRRDQVLGRRALDPMRLGIVGGVAALLLIVAIWAAWPSGPSAKEKAAMAAAEAASAASAAAAAQAASAASAAEAAAASAAAAQAASAASAAEAASEAASGASAPEAPASAASGAPAAASSPMAGGLIPGIRPTLHSGVERAQREREQAAANTPAGGGKDAVKDKTAAKDEKSPKDDKDAKASKDKAADAAKPGASAPATEAEKRLAVDDAGLTSLMKRGMVPGGKPVALVGLPVKSKADAEAQLARMREMIAATMGGTGPANADVFQTKEGWRAAVWPFATREEAQLINATLLARGMRARAVDF